MRHKASYTIDGARNTQPKPTPESPEQPEVCETLPTPKKQRRKAGANTSSPEPNTIEGIILAGQSQGKTPHEALEESGVIRPGDEFLTTERAS